MARLLSSFLCLALAAPLSAQESCHEGPFPFRTGDTWVYNATIDDGKFFARDSAFEGITTYRIVAVQPAGSNRFSVEIAFTDSGRIQHFSPETGSLVRTDSIRRGDFFLVWNQGDVTYGPTYPPNRGRFLDACFSNLISRQDSLWVDGKAHLARWTGSLGMFSSGPIIPSGSTPDTVRLPSTLPGYSSYHVFIDGIGSVAIGYGGTVKNHFPSFFFALLEHNGESFQSKLLSVGIKSRASRSEADQPRRSSIIENNRLLWKHEGHLIDGRR